MNKPPNDCPYVIGLTGNIATGKSSVAAMLERLGAQLIDADRLAHQVMRTGVLVQQIIERFGTDMLGGDGQIDRARLGAIVFADPQALGDLEAIVHPAVIEETCRLLDQSASSVCVIEAIKLLETELRQRCHAIWVVTCAPQIQAQRLVELRGLTAEQAWLRINAQAPQSAKAELADVVIDNSGALADTQEQVVHAWEAIPRHGAATNNACSAN